MLITSQEYKTAVTADVRRMVIKAIFDMISPDIVYGEGIAFDAAPTSRLSQLWDKDKTYDNPYATLELDRWRLDGSMEVYPDGYKNLLGQAGYESMRLSDEQCLFAEPYPWVMLPFSGVTVLQACSVWFPGGPDGVAADFTVDIMRGDTVAYRRQFEGNEEREAYLSGFTVYNPTGIKVTVSRWSRPSRRCRVVEIIPGLYEDWDGDVISSLRINQKVNMAGTALPYGTATLTIDNLDRRFEWRNKQGVFLSLEERQGIKISIGPELQGGKAETVPVGTFYQYSGGWKTSDNTAAITWELVDIIGLLSNRAFDVPDTLPTTLKGWGLCLVGQLGTRFENKLVISDALADIPMTVSREHLTGIKCGDVLRYICMAAACYPMADPVSGGLAILKPPSVGGGITLDNMESYPAIAAGDDVAYIDIKIYGNTEDTVRLSGTTTASANTLSIQNPFIHTREEALKVGRHILSCYGGQQISVVGRGNPADQCGDVMQIELDGSTATAARQISRELSFSGGVMKSLPSSFIRPDGAALYSERVVLTGSGQWTGPAGVTDFFAILVGGGQDGGNGTDGSWRGAEENGADGAGGKVFAARISINDGQIISYACGVGGVEPGETTFGIYSSAAGIRAGGYTDINSGEVYGRDGVSNPLPGSGDGGKGGSGGAAGNREWDDFEEKYEVDNYPGRGRKGAKGAAGSIIIWYERGGVE